MVAKGERVGREMDMGVVVSRCKFLYTEWKNNKVLLNSTNNYIQYPITNIMEKNILKECIYIYIYICNKQDWKLQ